MISNPFPLRADVADLQDSLIQGADAVILSEETAFGKHPIEAVQVLARVLATSERIIDGEKRFDRIKSHSNLDNSQEKLAYLIVNIIMEKRTDPIDLVLCLSSQGMMSRILAKYKMPVPLLSACPDS